MYIYVITRGLNREFMETEKCDPAIWLIINSTAYTSGEIGYTDSLDEAISIISEDADRLWLEFCMQKKALWYRIVKKKLGRINAMDEYGNWTECHTDDGVLYSIFEP